VKHEKQELNKFGFVAAIISLVAMSACVPVSEPKPAGFLSTYENLEIVADGRLFYTGSKIGQYSKFMLEPTILLFRRNPDEARFTEEELSELLAYFDKAILKELSEDNHNGAGYEIVDSPGDGVAKIRVGINKVEETIGVLNILIYTKITGAGLGGAAAEGELVDSLTGEQLTAAVRWGSGSRILRAGFTHTGDAKIAMHRWAKDLRHWIDFTHGRTGSEPGWHKASASPSDDSAGN
jgi:Protein of unknown function (DUF3313)